MNVTTPTLEICICTEWLRENCRLPLDEIRDGSENDAADAIADELFRLLDRAGFETERAQGERITYHGWNGMQLFSHKIGPVGTFDSLTSEQIAKIEAAIAAAVDHASREFAI